MSSGIYTDYLEGKTRKLK